MRSSGTYCEIFEYTQDLSEQINNMYNIQPIVYLMFNQDKNLSGAAIVAYKLSDMYIELNIPYNFTFGRKHKMEFACILVHEYCHYIDATTMSAKQRVLSVQKYTDNHEYKKADEYRNWTATKRLAKKLGLWNKAFYAVIQEYYYTSTLKF